MNKFDKIIQIGILMKNHNNIEELISKLEKEMDFRKTKSNNHEKSKVSKFHEGTYITINPTDTNYHELEEFTKIDDVWTI